jgi:NADH:ubiquinone oxidoreductase subunit 2 (subunit N)
MLLTSSLHLSGTAASTHLGGYESLALYVFGYVGLVVSFAFLLMSLGLATRQSAAPLSLLVRSEQLRVRWLLLGCLLSLAGLPPFAFFGCKLGLLTLLLRTASLQVGIAFGVLVFFSWVVYFSLVRQLLLTVSGVCAAPVRANRLFPAIAVLFLCISVVASTGLCWFEDAGL